MDWNDLKYVQALARAGTLAAAARTLGVEHSTVGRKVAALERQLGAQLFDRTPDGYVPTEAGRVALSKIKRVDAAVAGLERKISGRDSRLSGAVSITASDTFGSRFLAPRFRDFYAQYPDIELSLLTSDQLLNLAQREADVALRMLKPRQPNLVSRRLGEVAFAVYASTDYLERISAQRRPTSIEGHDVIGFQTMLQDIPAGRWLAKHEKSAHVVCRTNSLSTTAALATAGVGMAVLPCFLGDEPPLRRVLPEVARSEIWLAVHSDLHRSARIRAVIDFVADVIAREAPLLTGARPLR